MPPNSVYLHTNSAAFNDNAWHHVVCILDKTSNRAMIYVDNIKQTIYKDSQFAATGGTLTSSNTELDVTGLNCDSHPTDIGMIGASVNGQFFNGSIDDVAFYNYALSAAQVQALFQNGVGINEIGSTTSKILLYPNPTSSKVTVSSEDNVVSIKIYNQLSQNNNF